MSEHAGGEAASASGEPARAELHHPGEPPEARHELGVSFGFFNGTLDELRAAQEQYGRQEQVSGVDPYVEEVLLDGAYEVVEKLG